MLKAALLPTVLPTGHSTVRSYIPLANRNLELADGALKQALLLTQPSLPWYPKHNKTPQHQCSLYKLNLPYCAVRLFGKLRAGAIIFPQQSNQCPACGKNDVDPTHPLRRCISISPCLNEWLRLITRPERNMLMDLGDEAFVQTLLDLNNFSSETSRRATVEGSGNATTHDY